MKQSDQHIKNVMAQLERWIEFCERYDMTWGEAFIDNDLSY